MGQADWAVWGAPPTILIGITTAVGLYLLGTGPWRRRLKGNQVPTWQVVSFMLGMVVIVLTTMSPLHELSDHYLFSAHMVQHLLLTMVVPPLLIAGTPGWLLRPVLRVPGVLPVARFLTFPVTAFLVFNVVFGLSHVPGVYDFVLRSDTVHHLEHLLFLITAVIMWWPIMSPVEELPRPAYPVQLLYIFLQMLPISVVGAMITLSEPLYEFYFTAPRVFGLSLKADQELGGALMWVGNGLLMLAVFTVVFFSWAKREADAEDWHGAPPEPDRTAHQSIVGS